MATTTRNPALRRADFSKVHEAADGAVMTLAGTMRKTFILLAIMSAAMLYVWQGMPGIGLSPQVMYGLFIVGFVMGVGILLYTARDPEVARITGPSYAAVQGLVLGALTLVISQNPAYRGLPITAAVLTALLAWASARRHVVSALLAVALGFAVWGLDWYFMKTSPH